MFPATVKMMHSPKQIAIKIVCQSSKGGRGGVTVEVKSKNPEPFLVALDWSSRSMLESLPRMFNGSASQDLIKVVEFKACVHSVNDKIPL
jgi:hypothetical protein